MIQKWVFDNGANVLLDAFDTTGTASVGFWFLHGSRDEQESQRGVSHFLEHMLFKGTLRRDAFNIAREIDRVGGMLNAFTEKEITCFYITLPKEHISLALDVLSDMIFHSTLAAEEMEKEKSVIINEILSSLDSPDELAHELYLSSIWGNHPLAQKITGDVEDLKGSTRAELLEVYSERFVPSNLVIAAAGAFEPQRMADLIYAKIGAAQDRSFTKHRSAPSAGRFLRHEPSRFNQIQVYAGTDLGIPQGDHSRHYDALVFSNAVGETMSSRLFQEIREKQALCYSIACFRSLFTDAALWTIYCNTTPAQTSSMLAALNMELSRLLTHPLSETEIEDAKSHLAGSLTMAREDMEIRMKRLVRLHSMSLEIIEFEQSLGYIKSVSIDGVDRIVQDVVSKTQFNLLVYGGEKINNFEDYGFTFA